MCKITVFPTPSKYHIKHVLMAENEKLVIICTYGGENPEKATLPFVMATAAQAPMLKLLLFFSPTRLFLPRLVKQKNQVLRALSRLKS